MDINYLLWLQDFRYLTHDVWTPFIGGISSFGESYLLLLPLFIYWCLDKRRGLLTLASLYLCLTLTTLIKLTACVYRPWIKDPRIIPAGKLPTSYSFPSKHTSMAATLYLGSATTFWQRKPTKFLAILCILAALLTGFSRNYLGVHTPQDVLVGLLLSLSCLYTIWKLGDYLQKNPEKENWILLFTAIASIAALAYVCFKSYPMDYVDGKLLVNPHKLTRSAFESMGALFSFCIARYIEKTWIHFKQTGLHGKGILLGIIGLVLFCLLFALLKKPFISWMGKCWGRFVWSSVLVFYAITLYPLVLKYSCPPRASNKRNK